MSLIAVICGAVEVGVIWTTLFGIVTDWATGIVAPDAISPITTLTLSTLTSFVAASTEAAAWVCPSSDATSLRRDTGLLDALQRLVLDVDRDLDRLVEVRAVRRQVAREGQDVADPELERHLLLAPVGAGTGRGGADAGRAQRDQPQELSSSLHGPLLLPPT